MSRYGIVEIGNPRGKIALYLDEQEAIDMAWHYGPRDTFYDEMMKAVEQAYPPPSDEPQLGIEIRVSRG